MAQPPTFRGIKHEVSKPTIAFENVSVAYANNEDGNGHTGLRQYALQEVTFQIDRGERVAVVGPNGAGKSTLFNSIIGSVKLVNGRIHIYGSDPNAHICIAYVPQRSQIDWTFPVTVEDVVMMGRVGQIGLFRRPRRADWDKVHASLARVGVTAVAKKQIGELSGGQQQRVFIARALAQEAQLLLLDEPLAGLDIPSQNAVFNILDSLRPDGVTVLVATHDLQLAAKQFDQIILLNRKIIAMGSPKDVLQEKNLLRAYGGV